MNKTKIVATIGPASESKEVLKNFVYSGMDIARLNMSYGSHEFCKSVINSIKEINEELNTNVAIMIDIEGPIVKIGRLENKQALLVKGDKIRVYMESILGDSTKFSVSYPELIKDIKYNSVIKLEEGRVDLLVLEKGSNYLLCEVLNGGVIYENKSINIIDTKLNLPFLSEKDKKDIMFANKMDADFLALSFVSTGDDVLEVNDLLINYDNDHIGIISKIECESAVNDVDEIIRLSDGIMIARGDLGVEIPIERVPGIQKSIINKCHSMSKVSIVATEMLASMEQFNRPTRAEVSDVVNAVLDGVDSVMLSGETTVGKYPVETLKMMERIIQSAEEDINYLDLLDRAMRTEKQDTTGSIAFSVAECASRLKCKAIIAPTMSGYTARKMSRFRPVCPIIAVSPDKHAVRSLALHFGIHAHLIDNLNDLDDIIKKSTKMAKDLLDLREGDKIIVTGGYPFKEVKHTNFMKIEEL